MSDKILEVIDLRTYFYQAAGTAKAVDGVSFSIEKGKTFGIVGESGSGKSVTASSIIRLLPNTAKIESGQIIFKGKDLTQYSKSDMRKIRGKEIASVFQDPMTSLDPVFTIGQQIDELLKTHFPGLSKSERRKKAVEALNTVGITDGEQRLAAYPHEFSGGMRQRVMIAMAVVCDPVLLIADEPTTALDVTVQAQVFELMKDLQKRMNTSILLITHNLGAVWRMCDSVAVMYAGKCMEIAETKELYSNTLHPYTWGLLSSMPKLDSDSGEQLPTIPGTPPDLKLTGKGCGFAERCKYAQKACFDSSPKLTELKPGHWVACHLQTHDKRIELGEVV
ncbi:MAG: ABC transporter ATP-binding protein [Lachnospiraceae bacterium]